MRKMFFKAIVIFNFLLVPCVLGISVPCHYGAYTDGLVCHCNATYCDTLEFDLPENNVVRTVSTSQAGLRFEVDFIEKGKKKIEKVNVLINSTRKYQKILGFGASLTGAVVHHFKSLNPDLKAKLYAAYFCNKTGLGFTFMRTPIGGCDFDAAPWAYNELPEHDAGLSNFTRLDPRDFAKIAVIKEIQAQTGVALKLLGTAWSAPIWMKTNNNWNGFSALRAEYYETWALYHRRFLELMREQNVTFWGVTTGNEPMNGVMWWMFTRFMSMGWAPKDQGRWVADHLGPQLRAFSREIRLLAGDDQRYIFPWWFNQMKAANSKALDYVDGFAVHWYTDGFVPPQISLDLANENFPDKFILNTEACIGDKPTQHHGPVLGSWVRAILYIEAIFQDLRHSVNGWIDWNLILDEQGGPNYVNNFVDAPVIINSTTLTDAYKQPMFYVLGHFSRFIIPDSVRIHAKSSDSEVDVLAFDRPDQYKTLIVYNKRKVGVSVEFTTDGRTLEFYVPALSLNSVLYKD